MEVGKTKFWPSFIASIGALLLVGSFLAFRYRSHPPGPTPTLSPSSSTTWFRVFFSDPTGPQATTLRDGPDDYLAEAIGQAQESVDVAVYHLDLWSVRDALMDAQRRGVQIRVVTDNVHASEPEVLALETVGIPVVEDQGPSLMHHKFAVIDQQQVWTGSMNFTVTGAYCNDNNLLSIRSQRIAEDYQTEFEEMFLKRRFGALSMADTPYPLVAVEGRLLEIYFSPDDGVARQMVKVLREAQHSIDFMAYVLTSKPITEAILDQFHAGITIRGVVESSQVGITGSQVDRLIEAGIDVRFDTNPCNMHHKVMIVDREVVILGSYNFSRSAEEKNDENALIVHDGGVAVEYLREFERLFRAATP